MEDSDNKPYFTPRYVLKLALYFFSGVAISYFSCCSARAKKKAANKTSYNQAEYRPHEIFHVFPFPDPSPDEYYGPFELLQS